LVGLALTWLTACGTVAQQAAGPTWGYVDSLDGQTLTLDDGTVAKLTDGTKVVRADGADGTPQDLTRGARVVVVLDAEGTAGRVEVLPAPPAPEYYLTALSVRGATNMRAQAGGRTYPRSLAALKASFVTRPDVASLVGGVAYLPAKDSKVQAARLAILGPANDVLFQRSLKAGETADFRLNFAPGRQDTFTLIATPVGEGALEPDWCVWLDPRMVGPLPAPQAVGVFRRTAAALLADLKQALGDKQPGPIAVPLFVGQRVPNDQIIQDLQEDLVVCGVGMLSVAGKIAQRPELGMPLPDAVKAEAGKIGAQCVLVGSVSDRGELLVINATLVDLATGQIIATARASQ
jgi:hypothetical protein